MKMNRKKRKGSVRDMIRWESIDSTSPLSLQRRLFFRQAQAQLAALQSSVARLSAALVDAEAVAHSGRTSSKTELNRHVKTLERRLYEVFEIVRKDDKLPLFID